ncbi:hypothetical protein ACHAW6_014418 [Cyclotella cf. meneghiniana]
MWPRCAHILKPLTDNSGLKKHAPIPWAPNTQSTFDKMHALIAADALAANLDHNKQFGVYTNTSDFQLAVKVTAKLYSDG